jgi:hypothetical protein
MLKHLAAVLILVALPVAAQIEGTISGYSHSGW